MAIGKEFTICAFVDDDFAGVSLTHRSRTGFVVYLNGVPIFWFSKKQSSLETSLLVVNSWQWVQC